MGSAYTQYLNAVRGGCAITKIVVCDIDSNFVRVAPPKCSPQIIRHDSLEVLIRVHRAVAITRNDQICAAGTAATAAVPREVDPTYKLSALPRDGSKHIAMTSKNYDL